jgi:hypothetical protein
MVVLSRIFPVVALALVACPAKAPAPVAVAPARAEAAGPGGRWNETMLSPDKVIAKNSFGGETRELGPEASATLRKMLDDDDVFSPTASDERMRCGFNADLELEWHKGTKKEKVVFCFTCRETMGIIQQFSPQQLGAFARNLFPDSAAFERAALGLRAHVDQYLERWPLTVQLPDTVVAHRLGGAPLPRKTDGSADAGAPIVFELGGSAERVTLNAQQREQLEALLTSETAISGWPPRPARCTFNPDFALEWTRKEDKRQSVFSFACTEVLGNTGMVGFDGKQVGAFAAKLFPNHAPFQRVATGQKPR